jgi:hypothetical protein
MNQENQKPNKPEEQNSSVGVNLDILLTGFNGDQPIRAKIDTGAQASSLHGTDIKVITDDVSGTSTVRFSYGEFQYNMPVVSFQAITSADGGTVNRPVVNIAARINGEYIQDAMFNLNDRGNMDYPILIGLDLIKTAKLTIDPSIAEMDVSFGPEGFKKVDGQDDVPTDVDKSSDNVDNKESENFEHAFLNWFKENKARTLEDVFSELIGFVTKEGTNDVKTE